MAIAKKPGKSAGAVESKVLGKAVFQFKKETPGAVQYEEVGADGNKLQTANSLIGSLYLRKDKINGTYPKVLKVTVEA